jgi:Tfp pilus assembly protein PilO
MGALRSDRIWLFGGLALVAVLVATGWFLMIKPKYAEASDMRGQVEDTTAQLAKLNKHLADLKADNAHLAGYQAEQETYRKALPTADSIPAFLRQLQNMGSDLDVVVSAYTAAGHAKSAVVGTVEELPITLSASGTVPDVGRFVYQLQNTQPRAVLISSASLSFDGTKTVTLSLTLAAFRNTAATSTTVVTTTE